MSSKNNLFFSVQIEVIPYLLKRDRNSTDQIGKICCLPRQLQKFMQLLSTNFMRVCPFLHAISLKKSQVLKKYLYCLAKAVVLWDFATPNVEMCAY